MSGENKSILGAAIGNCVHVAGIIHFLQHAQREGYRTVFLGPAVTIDALFAEIDSSRPDMVAVGYRLTPENVMPLLSEIKLRSAGLGYTPTWVFGGTFPVAEAARGCGIFSFISDGYDDIDDAIRFLRNTSVRQEPVIYKQDVVSRITSSYPYPILRHHFGLPSLEETIRGIRKIAESSVLDVISLGPDQNAQQFFFHPEKMIHQFDGAGGVPVRTKEHFEALKLASQTGNFPLMRCYSGTENIFDYADLLLETINNAWAAIPLFWYNELDGRGTRSLEKSIQEAQALIAWHAKLGVPVEINDPHQWGLRDAHDVIQVAVAFIAAYNAKKLGVKQYISQYMFNTPHGVSFSMDLSRVMAMIEMVESLHDDDFVSYRQTRAGLALFAADESVAQGQLAASTFMQMAVKPHIMHVVGYCEADHAATAEEVIKSCRIAKGVIRHTLGEDFGMQDTKRIKARKNELVEEAKILLHYIEKQFGNFEDPLANSHVLAQCVRRGYLDAVHLVKGAGFRGSIATELRDGKCLALCGNTIVNETQRLKDLE